MKVLITGAGGQLGQCLLLSQPETYEVIGIDKEELDITDESAVRKYFQGESFDLCINCAAYTAVDLAESHEEMAFAINERGAQNIAEACSDTDCQLIHLSTDYVYHGRSADGLTEETEPDPQSVYASSKLKGEIAVQSASPGAIVIRTSWLYSEFGHNFFLTMMRLRKKDIVPRVVNDQYGTPTYARDLAEGIWKIAQSQPVSPGIYNLCNEGATTWHEFACEIFRLEEASRLPIPIPTSEYPTAAKRPPYSVMSTSKVRDTLGVSLRNWRDAVKDCHSRVVSGSQSDN